MFAPEQYRAITLHRAPKLYFPVTAPGDVAGPYHRLAPDSPGGESVLELDSERDQYLAAKRVALRGPLRLHAAGTDSALQRAETFLRTALCAAEPAHFSAAQLASWPLDALAMELQEDVVVLHRPAGYVSERARVHYLHVCFPSQWDPARMLGKNFLSIHARVPIEHDFARSERPRHAAALFARPAVRFIWSLTPDAQLDHHPDTPRGVDWSSTDQLFLRVERQVIMPLPAADGDASSDHVTLFLIRTYVYPRHRLDAVQRAVLVNNIADMSEPMRRYKGMLGHEARIIELLHAVKQPARAESVSRAG